jgi:hypothetical protein
MMVALVLYAFATGQRSSRGIERHCRQDLAYRVITANQVPDHATIARFLRRHEEPLGELFGSVLGLCAKAGLVETGVVAIDGTKMLANASRAQNVDYDRVAREILAEAKATDEAEDERHGQARGDELPPELSTEAGRREWLARELQAQRAANSESDADVIGLEQGESDRKEGHEFDAQRIVARVQGREGWLREAKRQLDHDRWATAGPIPRSRSERLRDAGQRLDADPCRRAPWQRGLSALPRDGTAKGRASVRRGTKAV